MMNGTRVSEARAYINPVRNRRNLFVRKQALVTRVLVHPVLRQAYGVQYQTARGRNVTVLARKEVSTAKWDHYAAPAARPPIGRAACAERVGSQPGGRVQPAR